MTTMISYHWAFFALLAQVVYTLVVYIDKYIISKKIRDYSCMPIYSAFVGMIAGSIIWASTGFPTLQGMDLAIVLSTGMLTLWGTYFYFKAMTMSAPSNIIFFMQMIPVIVLLLAYAFLHERISYQQCMGFIIVFISCIAVSVESIHGIFRLSRAFYLILLVDILWSIAAILMKLATGSISFSAILTYESFGIGLGGILLYGTFPAIRRSFRQNITSLTHHKSVILILFLNEAIFLMAEALKFFAYSLGPASMVSIIGSTQAFFGIFMGWGLTLIVPRFFHEPLRKKELYKKISWATVLLLGLFFLY